MKTEVKDFLSQKDKMLDELKLSKSLEKKLRKEFQELYEKFTKSAEEKYDLHQKVDDL